MTEPPTEQAFLDAYDPDRYPRVAVTVDIVVLTIRDGRLCVLLIRRGGHPQRGRWALPGGFITPTEDLDAAARRELAEETGLDPAAWHLEQLHAYGAPDRDPRLRVVSVAYLALVPDPPAPHAGSDADDARFWPVAEPGDGSRHLAFDHTQILGDALDRVSGMLEDTSLATTFLEQPFTVGELRRIYEAVWGQELHPANFRRKVLSTPGFVIPTGEYRATGRGRAELYRAGSTIRLHPPLPRPQPPEQP